ncbi:MAG: homoserine dehydrogenase [Thermodesulfovibrionales bacterium]|nr:homoserine dehydrogenase [Thermodesulfovibrionales bacterium]
MGNRDIRVGIIGFGTVGSGTVKVLLNNAETISSRLGFALELKCVADKDTESDRGVTLPGGVLVDDAEKVLDDPDIDIVVELVGGTTIAKDFILSALKKGKHVVTANKALLAEHGAEIFDEALRQGKQIGFEASVAGGIPIIKVLREALVANNFSSVHGIINGTANYILTKMTQEGGEFAEALDEAQRLGYAESDPTFDIEGVDAAHKLTLLASLAYGIPISYDKVYTEGITRITSLDIGLAAELGYKIKLLAIAKQTGGELELRVHPTMVPEDLLIAKVEGVFNAVHVKGDAVGDTLYYGRGAGDMPTASAVVADIAEIATSINLGSTSPTFRVADNPMRVMDIGEIHSQYYFRFSAVDRPGVLSRISGIFGENNISISSVIQKGRKADEVVPLVMLTHTAKESDIQRAVSEIEGLDVVADKPFYIRVEDDEGQEL